MTVVGDFTIPASSFGLEHALSTVPDMVIEAERLASHSPQEVFPFLWAAGGDFEAFREALEGDQTTTEISVDEVTEEEVMYRVVWDDEFCNLIHDMVDHHAAILEAKARDDEWDLRLRFSDEGMVSDFQRHFDETGHHFEVNQLYRPSDPRQRAYGLTSEQYDALEAAVEEGYFTIPRSASAEEVGDVLGVSANAASQRIRRGCETLIRSGLLLSDEEL